MKRGTIKQVLSGDSVKIWGPQRPNGPPIEKQLSLFGIYAPRLERRPTNDTKPTTKDEPYAWEAREYLRKTLVGGDVLFKVQVTIGNIEKGTIILGKDEATGININELMVKEGLVTVRGDPKNEDIRKLLDLEEVAKSQGKGRHSNSPGMIREVHWTHDRDVEKYNQRPLKAIIEHVRDGSTVRAFISPEENVYYYITLMISGIRCSTTKSEAKGADGETEEGSNDQQNEAKYCVEKHLLQRDCNIILMTMNNNNFIGSIIHPHGNIAEVLLKRGFAKCVEWSLPYVKADITALREAEKYAKDKRIGIWKDYVPTTPAIPVKDKEFTGTVAEIINGDSLTVRQQNGNVKKIFLSSIRPPKEKTGEEEGRTRAKGFRPLYDIPWMFEARECLRKLLIGRKVNVIVDYIQPARENLPEKVCCTVSIGKVNAALELVSKGLAQVVRHRLDDDQRSGQYNSLLEAESKAQKANLGVYNTKENPARKVLNISADIQKARLTLPTLMRHDKQEAIVEFVTSGSRLRLYIPKESSIVTFLLSGITCPRGARPNMNATGTMQVAEPFGEEALNFTKEKCMQRDVNITVQSMDKVGSFIGWLFVDNVNLSVALVREGLAQVHSTAERTEHKNSLREAEKYAKQNKLNIWKDYVEAPKEEEGHHEEDKVIERKVNYEKVIVTEITPEGRFFAQHTEQGPKLESLMNKIRQDFSTEPLPGAYTPKKGDLCAAKFSLDSQWYRAKVEKIQGPKVSVRYIDYGNREVLHSSSCAVLPASFVTERPYAVEYALACVDLPSVENDHREAAMTALRYDLLNKPLLLNVENKGAVPEVTLMDTSNNDIVKNLLSEGLLLVQKRRERRLQKLITEYTASQETAKRERLAIWEYGDITEDDA